VQETHSPTQTGQTTGYDSITVQAAPDHGVRASRTNDQQPRTRTSAVRFVESRSGHADLSSSPAVPVPTSSTSSAVKFELTKRKRSPQKQDYVETERKKQPTSQAEFDVVRWLILFFRFSSFLCVTGGGSGRQSIIIPTFFSLIMFH
jgi:hypothetical protein